MNNLGFMITSTDVSGPGFRSGERRVNRFARTSTMASNQVKRGWEGAFQELMTLGVVRRLGRAIGGIVKSSACGESEIFTVQKIGNKSTPVKMIANKK